jgi:hypothetical protein
MPKSHTWDGGQFQQLGRFVTAMSCNDLIIIADEDSIVEPERLDTIGDLTDLLFRMYARIACIGLEGSDMDLLDYKIVHAR